MIKAAIIRAREMKKNLNMRSSLLNLLRYAARFASSSKRTFLFIGSMEECMQSLVSEELINEVRESMYGERLN